MYRITLHCADCEYTLTLESSETDEATARYNIYTAPTWTAQHPHDRRYISDTLLVVDPTCATCNAPALDGYACCACTSPLCSAHAYISDSGVDLLCRYGLPDGDQRRQAFAVR